MRKIILLIICLYLGGIIMSSALDRANIFMLTSKLLKNNEILHNDLVLNGYGCKGGNISPDLAWINPPIETKSFAIICHDPDAPKENGWYHWLVVNIPLNVSSIEKGGKIEGSLETLTDFDSTGYNGAAPPVGHGIHHYNFTIYALDVEKLDVKAQDKPTEVEKEVLKHTLSKATLTGLYQR